MLVTRVTPRLSHVEQELPTLPEHLGSPPVFSGVRVARSLVLCVIFCRLLFVLCPFSFGDCIFCPSNFSHLVSSIKTFDFSLLYTTLPHDKLKTRLKETIHKVFSHRNYGSKCVLLGYNSTYFSNKIQKGKTCYSEEQVISMLEFLIDNILVSFGGTLFQQVVGIPMGTNCAPLLADLFLYSYESEFLQLLVKEKKIHEARSFNFTYRYIDDVLSINNSRFAEFLPLIYPPELELKKPQIPLRPHHIWTYTSNLTTVVKSVLTFMINGTTSILKS